MCLGFPGRVVAIDRAGATIDTEGRRRRASTLLLPDLEIGEWVWVAAGTVVAPVGVAAHEQADGRRRRQHRRSTRRSRKCVAHEMHGS